MSFQKLFKWSLAMMILFGQLWDPMLGYPQEVMSLKSAPTYSTSPILLGLKVHSENPLLFDFIIDRGSGSLSEEQFKAETQKILKYFFAGLTLPDQDVWVNLSPAEKNRIIPNALGQTEMGKAMLEQDYQLKKLAASLTNPQTELGKKYWQHAAVSGQGIKDSDEKLLSRVWIVPDVAKVVERDGVVLIDGSKLKVLMQNHFEQPRDPRSELAEETQEDCGKDQVFSDLILPKINEAVNESQDFVPVRQVYQAVILATWYKQALRNSLLGQVYANQSKVAGVTTDDPQVKERVYEQYLTAFKKGTYNFIQEQEDPLTGEMVPRKYFSGGIASLGKSVSSSSISNAEMAQRLLTHSAFVVTVQGEEPEEVAVSASPVEPTTLKDIEAILIARVIEKAQNLDPRIREKLETKSILMVDDSQAEIDLVKPIMAAIGFGQIFTAQNRDQAMRFFEDRTIDYVLTDLSLEDFDTQLGDPNLSGGFDIAINAKRRGIPVVMVTGSPPSPEKLEAVGLKDLPVFSKTDILGNARQLVDPLEAQKTINFPKFLVKAYGLAIPSFKERVTRKIGAYKDRLFKGTSSSGVTDDPDPTEFKDWEDQSWFDFYDLLRSDAKAALGEAVRSVLQPFLNSTQGPILELGSGQGFLVGVVPELKDRIIQSDLFMKSLSNNPHSTPKVATDSNQLAIGDQSVSGVVGYDFFDAFIDLQKSLHEIARVLKPGGPVLGFLDMAANNEPAASYAEKVKNEVLFLAAHQDPKTRRIAMTHYLRVNRNELRFKLKQAQEQRRIDPRVFAYLEFYVSQPGEALRQVMMSDNPQIQYEFFQNIFQVLIQLNIHPQEISQKDLYQEMITYELKKAGFKNIKFSTASGYVDYDRSEFYGFPQDKNLYEYNLGLKTNAYDPSIPKGKIRVVAKMVAFSAEKIASSSAAIRDDSYGGIDFNADKLNLQIKRDRQGVPLPLSEQNLSSIHLQGLVPVIIRMQPLNSLNISVFVHP